VKQLKQWLKGRVGLLMQGVMMDNTL
jgi:hypothetical protein